jgi:N utilization substance protein A
VGCCVGLRGIRIQNIVSELSGEKIDVVQWNADAATFIANALSPAQIIAVELKKSEGVAAVIVPDRQLSLAIGKEGQNARLAAKLTGWKIDIKMASVWEAERESVKPGIEAKEEVKEEITPEPVAVTAIKREFKTEEVSAEIPTTEEISKEVVEEEVSEARPVSFELPVTTKGELRFAEDILGTPSRGEGKGKKKKKSAPSKEREEEAPRVRKGRRQEITIEDEEEF